jgi:hypothetical protein
VKLDVNLPRPVEAELADSLVSRPTACADRMLVSTGECADHCCLALQLLKYLCELDE